MSKNPKPDYTEWFKRDTLRLKHLVNIAAQADPKGLPPDKGPWANIIEDLDYHIRLGHLEGIPGPQGVKRQSRVALEHLWAFVFGPDYIHHSRWNPIREVCRQWNAVRGLALTEPRQSRKTTAKAKEQCEARLIDLMANNSKPEKNRDDYFVDAQKEFPGLSKRAFDEARSHAIASTGNTNWNRPGPKPNSSQ